MDPYAVLGVPADASLQEATAAFRALAKQHHPDRHGALGPPAPTEVMARINAAFDEVRARAAARGVGRNDAAQAGGPAFGQRRGAWLPDPIRRAMGAELLAALEQQEDVTLVIPAATWASPETRLALTDRRLLWLADDQPTHRVRSLRFRDVQRVESKLAWPRRRGTASVRLRTRAGRRLDFGDLPADVALGIVRVVRGTR